MVMCLSLSVAWMCVVTAPCVCVCDLCSFGGCSDSVIKCPCYLLSLILYRKEKQVAVSCHFISAFLTF